MTGGGKVDVWQVLLEEMMTVVELMLGLVEEKAVAEVA